MTRDIFAAVAVKKITPNDTTDLPDGPCYAIKSGTDGTINMIDYGGNTCLNFPVVAGYNVERVRRVMTGGTATDLWAIY